MTIMRVINLRKLIISLATSLGIGLLSSLFTMNSSEAYMNLIQPSFAPPPWLFRPVWTILYILMGLAFYIVWENSTNKQELRSASFYYFTQLFLNFLWSVIFFGLELRGLAFIEILILLAFIIITTVKFYRIDKCAGYLMIPYIIWVAYATLLNYSIWLLNM